ncbi:MAG: hypothetical protein ABI605_19825 [Rhizobacter sp.]
MKRQLLRNSRSLTRLLSVAWAVGIVGAGVGAWHLRPLSIGVLITLSFGAALLAVWARWQREVALREAPLPQFLKRKLRETYPQLSGKDCDLVERGLRQYFLACLRSKKKFVAMPSKAVDAMWHEFILHTRAYREWCDLTLGWFLHHTPAEVLGPKSIGNDGLRRAWYWACRDESIKPRSPTRLPLLFALDGKLGISNGFQYVADCRSIDRKSAMGGDGSGSYCGTDFSSDSFSGDVGGMGGSESSSSNSGFGSWSSDDSSDGDGGDGGCGGSGD